MTWSYNLSDAPNKSTRVTQADTREIVRRRGFDFVIIDMSRLSERENCLAISRRFNYNFMISCSIYARAKAPIEQRGHCRRTKERRWRVCIARDDNYIRIVAVSWERKASGTFWAVIRSLIPRSCDERLSLFAAFRSTMCHSWSFVRRNDIERFPARGKDEHNS